MDNESLFLAYGLVLAAVLISYANRLRMEGEMVWSSIRATLQLVVMGFLLEWILQIERMGGLLLILLFMSGVAAAISGNRGRDVPYSHFIAFGGIVAGSVVTFLVLYAAGVIRPEAQYVIPLGGMIIGNSMKASSLALNRLIAELGHQRRQIETQLALGATARQATVSSVRQAVQAALMPTVDTLKTVGLVHLPGIMTGYIIAGGSPLTAIQYQLAVMYMLAGATGITCLVVTLAAYRVCFTRELQLLDRFRPA